MNQVGHQVGNDAVDAVRDVEQGVAAVGIDAIMRSNQSLLERIRVTYASSDDEFERDVLSVLRSVIAYTHLLPATPDNYFSQAGGLARMAMETTLFALQGADAHILSTASVPGVRRAQERQLLLATAIAAMTAELHRPVTHLVVVSQAGDEWPAYLMPLSAWVAERGVDRYFVRWYPKRSEARAAGLFAARQVVPPQLLARLSEGNNFVVPWMLSAIGGLPSHREQNIVDRIVRAATAVVIERDLARTASRYGRPILGAHLERYLVDAMQRLTALGQWRANCDRGHLWFGADGLFLAWPEGAEDVIALLEKERVSGVPRSPDTIAQVLADAGVLARSDSGQVVQRIEPPGAHRPVSSVRLSSPWILLGVLDEPPRPMPQKLLPEPAATQPSSTPFGGQEAQQLPLVSGAAPAQQSSSVRFALRDNGVFRHEFGQRLARIVDSLNDPSTAACCTTPSGVFIPLTAFGSEHKASEAVSLLYDAGAIVVSKQGRTVEQQFNGATVRGVVLRKELVEGLA